MKVASVSPWFQIADVVTAKSASTGWYVAPVMSEAEAEYEADRLNGTAAKVVGRNVTHTPVRISKEAHIGYLADMDQAWRHQHIEMLRKRASAPQEQLHAGQSASLSMGAR